MMRRFLISLFGMFVLATLTDTQLELHYVGRNHSDNSLVMFLPRGLSLR